MSAPQTNIEKQKRRHRGPLIGMAAVIVFVAAIMIYWQVEATDTDASVPSAVTSVPGGTATPPAAP